MLRSSEEITLPINGNQNAQIDGFEKDLFIPPGLTLELLSTPVKSKSDTSLRLSHLNLTKTNSGSKTSKDYISKDLLQKIEEPSPIHFLKYKNSDEINSLKESPNSDIINDKVFNLDCTSSQNFETFDLRERKVFNDNTSRNCNNKSDLLNYIIYNSNIEKNVCFKPQTQIFDPFTNMNSLQNVQFNHQAFSPTHFTPNYYEEIRAINNSNDKFLAKLNLDEKNSHNPLQLFNKNESKMFQSINKFDKLGVNCFNSRFFKEQPNHVDSQNTQPKRKFCERKGDWVCIICKNLNFKFRKLCNLCKLPKENSRKLFEKHLENISLHSKFNEGLQYQYSNNSSSLLGSVKNNYNTISYNPLNYQNYFNQFNLQNNYCNNSQK